MSKDGWRGWERTRERGERLFVWVHGVVGWGMTMAVLWTIHHAVVKQDETPWYVIGAIALPIFTLGGYAWGKLMWRFMERKYHAATEKTAA